MRSGRQHTNDSEFKKHKPVHVPLLYVRVIFRPVVFTSSHKHVLPTHL